MLLCVQISVSNIVTLDTKQHGWGHLVVCMVLVLIYIMSVSFNGLAADATW